MRAPTVSTGATIKRPPTSAVRSGAGELAATPTLHRPNAVRRSPLQRSTLGDGAARSQHENRGGGEQDEGGGAPYPCLPPRVNIHTTSRRVRPSNKYIARTLFRFGGAGSSVRSGFDDTCLTLLNSRSGCGTSPLSSSYCCGVLDTYSKPRTCCLRYVRGYPIYRCGTGVYQRGGGLELWGSVTGGTYEYE